MPATTRAGLRARPGFALPLALFFIGLMTITLAASYSMSSGEGRNNTSQQAQQRAYDAATIGLETYLAGRGAIFGLSGVPGAANNSFIESVSMQTAFTGATDSAYVAAHRLRAESGTPGQPNYIPALYVVRSRGVHRGNRIAGAGVAERTVGILSIYERGNLQVLAGWTSLSGLRKNGNAGILSGVDACPAAQGGAAPTVAGIAVPTGQFSGNDDAMAGDPPIRYLGTQAQAEEAVKIDWDGIKNGTAISADFTDRWPPNPSAWDNPNYWPIIHWNDPPAVLTLPKMHNTQRGMLIVEGDLDINGNTTWDGIILVGGKLTSNGNNTVYGAVVTGLNQKLEADEVNTQDASDAGNGMKIYQYNSCNVRNAAASMGAMRPVRNTYVDNWRSF